MGYIQIDRNISNNWVWQKKPYSYGQAWIDLLLLANYKENKRINNNKIIISDRGEINLSILYLSNKWGWDRKKTTRFLTLLEKDNMVELNKTKNGTTIRITNYNVYQQNQGDLRQQTGQQKDNNSTYIKKEINNNKETISKDIVKKVFTKPTIDEISDYCKEKNYGVDPEQFYNFYESKGWYVGKSKMVSWKSCLATWQKRIKQDEPKLPHWFDNEPKERERTYEEQQQLDELIRGY